MFRAMVVSLLAGLAAFTYFSLAAPTAANPNELSHSVVKVEIGSVGSGAGGSGVYVGHGLILTAAHVATQAEQLFGPPLAFGTAPRNDLWITDYYGNHYHARIAYVSEDRDYAVLKVTNFKGTAASLSCQVVHVNDPVILIGQPYLLFPWAVQSGIVSSNKTMDIPQLHEVSLVPLALSIAPGDSGGPIFNTRGEIVGIAVIGSGSGNSAMVASADICSELP